MNENKTLEKYLSRMAKIRNEKQIIKECYEKGKFINNYDKKEINKKRKNERELTFGEINLITTLCSPRDVTSTIDNTQS